MSTKQMSTTTQTTLNRRDYELLNHCVFSDAEWQRILNDEPHQGYLIMTTNGYELAAWRLPNGSKHVCLKDDTEATWEAYCGSLVRKVAAGSAADLRSAAR